MIASSEIPLLFVGDTVSLSKEDYSDMVSLCQWQFQQRLKTDNRCTEGAVKKTSDHESLIIRRIRLKERTGELVG